MRNTVPAESSAFAWLAKWVQRKVPYDEQLVRMDGRRDVVVDSGLRTGSGPAGRHDQQGIHQVIARSRVAFEVNCEACRETYAWQPVHWFNKKPGGRLRWYLKTHENQRKVINHEKESN